MNRIQSLIWGWFLIGIGGSLAISSLLAFSSSSVIGCLIWILVALSGLSFVTSPLQQDQRKA